MKRQYVCIDLKSFYASVECVERGLDPFDTNLIVADPERSEKTICLAVSPAMKKLGVKNRCRVFQIPSDIDYIMAEPRMKLYIDYSVRIYSIYLSYIAKEDIHIYSIDEVFMDVTNYMDMYRMDARALSRRIIDDIYKNTGITATCGIGTNLYLAKIALDITAKHSPDNIGQLDEESYRLELWDHRPLTDFWRIGKGTAKRLERSGILTMGQIAAADEEMLYRLFGIDAELIIDHAWGIEPTTIADIKSYRPSSRSVTSGQVLPRDYSYTDCRLIVKEMTENLCLELSKKRLKATGISLYLGYTKYAAKKSDNISCSLGSTYASSKKLASDMLRLYDRIADRKVPIRRLNIAFSVVNDTDGGQLDLFSSVAERERERAMQNAVLELKSRFGKNAVIRGMNLEEAGTAIERNRQIGGHKSGEKTENGQGGKGKAVYGVRRA